MTYLHHLFQSFILLLFTILAASSTFALSSDWQRVQFLAYSQEISIEAPHIANTARARPFDRQNVTSTGTLLTGNGDVRAVIAKACAMERCYLHISPDDPRWQQRYDLAKDYAANQAAYNGHWDSVITPAQTNAWLGSSAAYGSGDALDDFERSGLLTYPDAIDRLAMLALGTPDAGAAILLDSSMRDALTQATVHASNPDAVYAALDQTFPPEVRNYLQAVQDDTQLGPFDLLEARIKALKALGDKDLSMQAVKDTLSAFLKDESGSVRLPGRAPNRTLPSSYTRNADGSITGPSGGKAWDTQLTDASGNPVYRRDSGSGYYTIDGNGRQVSANSPYTSDVPQIHHVCTNKCNVGSGGNPAWTPRFQRFFDDAGLDINGELNRVAVPGHRGPHPQEYHQYVFRELRNATNGVAANTPEYTNRVSTVLSRLRTEAVTPGHQVNSWLTGR